MFNNIPWTSVPFLIGYAAVGLVLVVIGILVAVLRRSRAKEDEETDEAPEVVPLKEVKHSRFFTEYYGGAFFFMIAAFAAAALYVIRPIILDIKETGIQIAQTQQSLQDQKKILGVLDQSVAAAQTIATDTLERVELALPLDAGYPYILVDLAAAANRNGVRVNSVNFSEPKVNQASKGKPDLTKGTVVPVNLATSLKATRYFDVKRMLADLESNLRVMDVTAIALTAGSEGNFDYNVQIRSYMFLPPGVTLPAP